jgi:DNA-binding NarL/FixJ family response regulator
MQKLPSPKTINEISVLVVDNQSLVHELITTALRDVNVKQVSSAMNAYHALRLCNEYEFDIVILAFNVSNDKDGFHLLEELKYHNHITNKTTVVFLSAETSIELVNCIVELQPDDFWVKPLNRRHIQQRLSYLIQIRRTLHKLYHCLYSGDYSAAIYHAERQLNDPSMAEYHPRLKRIIGDCLLQLREFEAAEQYFLALRKDYDHGWVSLGLARSIIRQDRIDDAQDLIDEMLLRTDTRFLTYDLLAQYYISKEDFAQAYEQIKQASRLAPRNIDRNKKLWDLARLNHDKHGQLSAVQNMAKYAKNSIHDSPQLSLYVIRAMVDLASSVSEIECNALLRRAKQELATIKTTHSHGESLSMQSSVLEVRILCLENEKKLAEEILSAKKVKHLRLNLEDNLDLMKAYHEVGMKEKCLAILDKLSAQVEGDTFAGQVIDEYLQQESIERREIKFTTKELKDMASVNYREHRMVPAYNNLRHALILSPQNYQVALSLLKVLLQLQGQGPLNEEQYEQGVKAIKMLQAADLPTSLQQKCDAYASAFTSKSKL